MSETSTLTGPIVAALTKAGYFCIRLNSGTARIGKYYVRLCPAGTADILVCPPQQLPLWIETKEIRDMKRKGETADKQAEFAERVRSLGHRYLRASSLDSVLEVLKVLNAKV